MATSVIKLNNPFSVRRYLTANDDLDDFHTRESAGIYYISSTPPANAPTYHHNGNIMYYSIVEVIVTGDGATVLQRVTNGGLNYQVYVYERYWSGSPAQWTPWKETSNSANIVSDLNNITETGYYFFRVDSSASNYPGARDGNLMVINSNRIISQLVVSADGTWTRRQYNGTWSNWMQLYFRPSYTIASGTYITDTWSKKSCTCTWTAPADGLYLIWMQFHLPDGQNTATNRQAYKQLQMRLLSGTAQFLMAAMLYYDSTISANGAFTTRTISQPAIVKAGAQIEPYIHTGVAGIEFTCKIVAVKISDVY